MVRLFTPWWGQRRLGFSPLFSRGISNSKQDNKGACAYTLGRGADGSSDFEAIVLFDQSS